MLWAVNRWLGGLAVAALLAGEAAAQGQNGSILGASMRGAYSTERAMSLIYGEYDADAKSAAWSAWQGPNYNKLWPETVEVRVLADLSYSDSAIPRHMVITWARPEEQGAGEFSCHACGALLGVTVLRRDAESWKSEAGNLELATIGSWGNPPQVKLSQLGDHIWGFTAEMNDVYDGELQQRFWVFGPSGGGFNEWFKASEVNDGRYGVFPQDNWCAQRTNSDDLLCAIAVEPGRAIYMTSIDGCSFNIRPITDIMYSQL